MALCASKRFGVCTAGCSADAAATSAAGALKRAASKHLIRDSSPIRCAQHLSATYHHLLAIFCHLYVMFPHLLRESLSPTRDGPSRTRDDRARTRDDTSTRRAAAPPPSRLYKIHTSPNVRLFVLPMPCYVFNSKGALWASIAGRLQRRRFEGRRGSAICAAPPSPCCRHGGRWRCSS
jgi:hypothetical protein